MTKGGNVEEHTHHQWQPHAAIAHGFFSKRGDGSDAHWFVGQTMKCVEPGCPMFLFIPSDKSFTPVECEPANEACAENARVNLPKAAA